MNKGFRIELATAADAEHLPDIERRAGEAFRAVPGLEWVADDDVTSAEEYRPCIELGVSWMARDDGDPVGFLVAEPVDTDLHILEVAVLPECQKRGFGQALFDAALAKARSMNLSGLTLTTFRDLAFNEKFYASLGFRTLEDGETPEYLLEELATQAENGLPRERRCAMRMML
ncbi:MAG: GNAT family N-acetyltransferase [Sphingomonadaceae bacterium]|nr:GNAT family N-acetyltransferase [Sphingomonadaceae bacterium]